MSYDIRVEAQNDWGNPSDLPKGNNILNMTK